MRDKDRSETIEVQTMAAKFSLSTLATVYHIELTVHLYNLR